MMTMSFRMMIRRAVHLGCAGALLMVVGCGQNDPAGAVDRSAPADSTGVRTEETPDEPPRQISPIESFTFKVSGVTPSLSVPDVSQLRLSGGCAAPSRMSIGFFSGSPASEDFFQFAMDSAEPVAQGQVGEVTLSGITWDDGVTAPEDLPNVKVPNRYTGSGILKISAHTGRGMGGRMSGVVTGEVSQRGSGTAGTIEVAFVINLACAG